MNKMICLAVCLTPLFVTPALAQDSSKTQPAKRGILGQILDQVTGGSTASISGLSASEIASGLKQALEIGASNGSAQASATDGFFKNSLIKIAFPPDAQKVAARLRQIGLGPQVDKFELSLNRAAEDAAKKAKPVFVKAITSMSIQDAVGILRGSDTAATAYLRRTSGQELVAQFTPIVDSTLKLNRATQYYGDLVNTYNRLPFVQKVNPDLTQYATGKAVDGLFILVAQEEKKIRVNPAARVTELLKRVFSKQ
ncbi:DUF4197 domain-containing protein [Spirosoma rhododendri]|uniref:DUF4197 domain-containing protein n=1 Tax=Spirosoma rhododendri TaxID=2728024 RepID=A0A7L5DYH6_9BACT|nr:DUF4197 domain-containing protein [Spirosoma rhododendri]QJD80570.1 DUF4197 domain-containing protein [Spirosoma rhododendri]